MADRTEIIENDKAGTLPQMLAESVRRDTGGELSASLCTLLATMHNDGTIDILEVARTIGNSPIDQYDFFFVSHVFVNMVPLLDADAQTMVTAVKALVARGGNDGAASMPNGGFRKWLEIGDRARETLAAIDPTDPADSAYLFLSLQALAKSEPDAALDDAITYLAGTSAPARGASAKAIGTFALVTPESRRRACDALAAAAFTADDKVLGHILTAMCEIARAHPEIAPDVAAFIQSNVSEVADDAVHQLALEFMFHGHELPSEVVGSLTAIMHKAPLAKGGTIEIIDSAAANLVTRNRLQEALAVITPLLSSHEELTSLEALDGFASAVLQLPADEVALVVVDWLLSLDSNLGRATMSLVGNYFGQKPLILRLDGATLDLVDSDRILLAHRAIGWLFVHPVTAASLVLGLFDGAGDAAAEVMADVLFDPLLINFTGALGDWIAERAKDIEHPSQPILADLVARLEAYITGLNRAGRINELKPSERERLIEKQRQHESMRQAHKKAEKKSLLAALATRQVLLYGARSISYFEGPSGENQRSEIKMHTFSHSIETPRIDVLEPFDLDYTLRVFRVMRKAAP